MTAGQPLRARRRQKIEELCAATLRALTGDAGLHYRGRCWHHGTRPLPPQAPHLRLDPDRDGLADFRAAADGTALRLLHSDAALHRIRCPADPVERLIFELLEQLRVETLVPADLPGMAANLRHRFEAWSLALHHAGVTDSQLGVLLYTVTQVCWSRLSTLPVLEDTEGAIEATRAAIAPMLGAPLAGIRRHRQDQAAFSVHALAIARIVGATVRAAKAGRSAGDVAERKQEDELAALSLRLGFDRAEGDDSAAASAGEGKAFGDAGRGYRVYTSRYDTEVAAGPLVRKALLREYRERLDRLIAGQGMNVVRLARVFGAILGEPCRDGWLFGEEEGQVDGRRLARLISSPAERRLFRRERHPPAANCLVSFLVDCSGSMKSHIEPVATMIDILIRALEMAGVSTDLLGFTTGAWNGGRAHREWMSRGRPRNPGRLNEICHLVFKDADRSWRRSRAEIAALLKADLFREGIDGEAVDWACERMIARSEPRRILIVISDGCPMDRATGLANDALYLDNHLREVLARRERQGAVEILGLGVGLDLGTFYPRHLATDMGYPLDNSLFFEIAQLIGGRRRR